MDSLGKIMAGIIALILTFIIPAQYIQIHNEDIFHDHVENETISFFNHIKNKGYISIDDYETFLNKISITGENYDIEIEHATPSVSNSFSKALFDYLICSNDNKIYNINLLSNDFGHIHTDNCYAGHRHNQNGCSLINFYSGEAVSCYSETYYQGWNEYGSRYTTKVLFCSRCRNSIAYAVYSESNRGLSYYNQVVESLGFYVYYLNQNGNVTIKSYKTLNKHLISNEGGDGWEVGYGIYYKINPDWTNYLNIYNLLGSNVTNWTKVGYKIEYSCPYCLANNRINKTLVSEWSCDLLEDEVPLCDDVVVGLDATNPNQVISLGQNIITTAYATYLNGQSGVVNCASNFNHNILGTQNVTLTYTGLVNNAKNHGNISCQIEVTVVDNRPELLYISVNPDIQSIKKYDNPSFNVYAYYDDGSVLQVTNYIVSGLDITTLGRQSVKITYSENNISKSATVIVNVTPLQKKCNACGFIYDLDENDFDRGCPACRQTIESIIAVPNRIDLSLGDDLNISVYAKYRDGHTSLISGWTSNYMPYLLGYQEVKISYLDFYTYVIVNVINKRNCHICGLEYDLNLDGSDPGCPDCKTTVISISASPTTQTINYGDPLILAVTALYRDGHTELVTDWVSDFNINQVGFQKVTITYNNLSCIVTVNVLDYDTVICPICNLSYSYSSSPLGCPVCYYTLIAIYPSLADGGNKILYGSSLDLEVILLYKDGHFALTYDDWICRNYNPNRIGEQEITIEVTDKFGNTVSANLLIEVVDRLIRKVCPNGHFYYISEYEEDTGCPYCTGINEAEIKKFYEVNYTGYIISELYQKGKYIFSPGDYITIKVIKKERNIVLKFLFKDKKIIYGGEIT